MPKVVRSAPLLGAVLGLCLFFPTLVSPAKSANKLDSFAQCLAQKGATMYGAFWCPHCAEQKELFGSSFQYVKYVECGVKGNIRAQTQVCKDLAITQYPTWIFADNERMEHKQELQKLSTKTGCKLP